MRCGGYKGGEAALHWLEVLWHVNEVAPWRRFLYNAPSGVACLLGDDGEESVVNVRWLWVPMVGASVFLALPGHSTIDGVLGDVVGHFFSAALVAVVPVVGYRLIYKDIGEKEITYIFAASWAYLVISQILKL